MKILIAIFVGVAIIEILIAAGAELREYFREEDKNEGEV